MILDTTTKSIELILGSAVTTNAMPVTVDYVDMTTTTTLAGSSDTQSNGVTAVTIVASPAASTQRKVNSISIYNADTAAKVVTIRLNNNTTLRNMVVITLAVGYTIGYTDVDGWYLIDSSGQRQMSMPGYALLAGSASQTFSVAAATAVAHAVRADQIQGQSLTAFTTGGTSTAFTLTPTPAITAYTAGQRFNVTFSTACGAAPTLQISGIATPPNLVRQNADGTYSNLAANAFPNNWNSDCILISASQVLVEKLPPETGAFTLTAVGLTTSPTVTASYTTNGKSVVLKFNGLSGTSNSTSFSATGVPAALRPTTPQHTIIRGEDNGIVALSTALIETTGSITFRYGSSGAAASWTAAGTKSFGSGVVIAYNLY